MSESLPDSESSESELMALPGLSEKIETGRKHDATPVLALHQKCMSPKRLLETPCVAFTRFRGF